MSKAFLKRQGWRITPKAGLDVSTGTPCISRGRHFSLELHKSRPARCGSPTRLSPDPLTPAYPRPDKREEGIGGEDWKKKRATGQFIASWEVARVPRSSGLFSGSHHPIQSPQCGHASFHL